MGHVVSTDVELVEASTKGRVDAFAQLVERYQSMVCAVSYSATGDLALSEDVAQETFVAAWNGLSDLREPSKLRGWLCGIARNLSSKAIRRIGREIPSDAGVQAAINEMATSPSPLDDALEKESEQLVWTALHNVPETYREPLVLFYREDQSTKQVAEALGLSENAVQQRLSRGRQHLKASVADLVERTLERTKPSKGFAAGVVAAISAGAAGTAEAVATQVASSASSASGGSMLAKAGGLLTMKLTTKLAVVAALVLLAAGGTVLVAQLRHDDEADKQLAKQGGQSATVPTAARRAGAEDRARLAFPPVEQDDPAGSLRLEGQVINVNDQPVAGARVFLASNPPVFARSEPDGSFVFTKLIGRRYELWAHADDLVSGSVFQQLGDGSDPVSVRVREGMQLAVTVVEAQTDKPIPNAVVRWTGEDALAVATDADGLAVLRGIMPGEHTIEIEASGFAMKSESRAIPDSAGLVLKHRVALNRGVAVSGTVLDEQGDPISGARVEVTDAHTQDSASHEVSTDTSGTFTIPALASGTYRCVAAHPDHAPTSSPPIVIENASVDDVKIVMASGGVVAGRVISKSAQPVGA